MMVTGEPTEVPVEGLEYALVWCPGPVPCIQHLTASEPISRADTATRTLPSAVAQGNGGLASLWVKLQQIFSIWGNLSGSSM